MSSEEQKTFITQGDEAGVSVGGWTLSSSSASRPVISLGAEELQSLRLHEKVEELKSLDEHYAAHRARYEERMRRVAEGEAAYAEKRHQTVAYLRRFKTFIAETDTKRLRAEKKEAEERRQKEEKEEELLSLHKQLRRLIRQRNSIQRKVEVYRQYRAYLESVLVQSEQYTEIDELMTRHQILQQTQSDLSSQSQSTSEKLEEMQQTMQIKIKAKQNSVVLQTSEYALLLVQLESLSNANSSEDASLTAWESQHTAGLRYATEVNLAIRNIHARITQQRSIDKLKFNNMGVRDNKEKRRASQPLPPQVTSATQRSPLSKSPAADESRGGEDSPGRSSAPTPILLSKRVVSVVPPSSMDLTVEEVEAQKWRQAEAGHQAYIDGMNSHGNKAWGEKRGKAKAQQNVNNQLEQIKGRGDGVAASRQPRQSVNFQGAASTEGAGKANQADRQRRNSNNNNNNTSNNNNSTLTSSSSSSFSTSSSTLAFLSSLLSIINDRIGDLQFITQAVTAEERAQFQAAAVNRMAALAQRQQMQAEQMQQQQTQMIDNSTHSVNSPSPSASSASIGGGKASSSSSSSFSMLSSAAAPSFSSTQHVHISATV